MTAKDIDSREFYGREQITVKDIELRGRKEICKFLCTKSWFTAKRRLQRIGLFAHEGGRPVLNIEAYKIASLENHKKE